LLKKCVSNSAIIVQKENKPSLVEKYINIFFECFNHFYRRYFRVGSVPGAQPGTNQINTTARCMSCECLSRFLIADLAHVHLGWRQARKK